MDGDEHGTRLEDAMVCDLYGAYTLCTWAAPLSCTNTRPQTATRITANHGVNDPRRVPWLHPQGTAMGSFTPWLAY